MSLVPNTAGPQGMFHVNNIQLTRLHLHLSLSPTFLIAVFSIHGACLVYGARSYTVVPVRLGQTQFRHLFCDVLVLVFHAHGCYTCTGTFQSPHWCQQNFSSPLHLSVIIIGIQPLGWFGQKPELSQATGMTLLRCILGRFLGVVCHCFPPRLDFPTFATRCLHIRHDARDSSGGGWNCGRECCPVVLLKWRLPRHLGIFYMPQIYDMGPTALLPAEDFFRP